MRVYSDSQIVALHYSFGQKMKAVSMVSQEVLHKARFKQMAPNLMRDIKTDSFMWTSDDLFIKVHF